MGKELQPRTPGVSPGSSPFDAIRHVDPDGSEWWSGRELGRKLGYSSWQRMEAAVERAKISCATFGLDPTDHFNVHVKSVQFGEGGKAAADYELTRYGCYLIAMNGDSRKKQIAAAQGYFYVMVRTAELASERPVQKVLVAGPWSVRIRDSLTPHLRELHVKCPGHFSVMSGAFPYILIIEDEIVRHEMETLAADLPDGSFGQCWANHRRLKLGFPDVEKRADLYIPARGYYVRTLVYPNGERGAFDHWFNAIYLPEKFPSYLLRKESLKRYGQWPCVSTADNVCHLLTGSGAHLNPVQRKRLDRSNNFIPASKAPQLTCAHPMLF